MSVVDRYAYRVFWSAEDDAFVGAVAELPSLSWLAETDVEALQGVKQLVTEVVQDMEQTGEPLPEPIWEHVYSGKFLVRIAPELHRELVLEANEQGISLNKLVASRLSGVSRSHVPTPSGESFARSVSEQILAAQQELDRMLATAQSEVENLNRQRDSIRSHLQQLRQMFGDRSQPENRVTSGVDVAFSGASQGA